MTRYCDAFERYDLDALVAPLHEDAGQSMPPYDMWVRGPERMRAWWSGPGIARRGSRLTPISETLRPSP